MASCSIAVGLSVLALVVGLGRKWAQSWLMIPVSGSARAQVQQQQSRLAEQ